MSIKIERVFESEKNIWAAWIWPVSDISAQTTVKSFVPFAEILLPKQVHGNRIVGLRDACVPLEKADGVTTSNPEMAVAVRSADCVPIIGFDSVTGFVGAVHAGWRGLLNGAVEARAI